MSGLPSAVRQLAQLVRAPEPGTNNIGAFVIEHAEALSPLLGLPEPAIASLVDVPDEVLVPELASRLANLRYADGERLARRAASLSLDAADKVAHTARRDQGRVIVDADILLGDLLADRTRRFVRFDDEGSFSVAVPHDRLVESRVLRRMFIDLAAWVDQHGVHLRWKSGCGGINWKPVQVPPTPQDRVLTVAFHRRTYERDSRMPTLVGDVLEALGLSA